MASPPTTTKERSTPTSRLMSTSGSLPPKEALAVSQSRLKALKALAVAPHLSERRRAVIKNLVRAQAAVVKKREHFLKVLN